MPKQIGGYQSISNRNNVDRSANEQQIGAPFTQIRVDLLHFWSDGALDLDAPPTDLQGVSLIDGITIAIYQLQETVGVLPYTYALLQVIQLDDLSYKLDRVIIDNFAIISITKGWYVGNTLQLFFNTDISLNEWHWHVLRTDLLSLVPYDKSNTSDLLTQPNISYRSLDVYNKVRLKNANPTDSQITLKAPNVTGDTYEIVLPKDEPTSNKYLKFDGTDYVWDSAGGISVSTPYSAIATNSAGTDVVESPNVFIDNPTVFNSVTTPLYIKNTDPSDTGILIDSRDGGGTSLYVYAGDSAEDMEAVSIYGLRTVSTAPLLIIFGAHDNIATLFHAESYDAGVITRIDENADIINTGFTANTLLYADTDKKIKSLTNGNLVKFLEITITSLQILNSFTTPIEIVPLITGKFLNVEKILLSITTGTDYITAGDVFIEYGTSNGYLTSVNALLTGSALSTTIFSIIPTTVGGVLSENIQLRADTSNPTTGTRDLKVRVYYTEIDW